MSWFLKGVKKGKMTEKFPQSPPEDAAIWSTGLMGSGDVDCPTGAIEDGKWNQDRCIFCRRCYPKYSPTGDVKLYRVINKNTTFRRSFYLYPIDVGSCGGCNAELKLLSSPQYDMTRFGIFFTSTPRHADALIALGVLSERMREPLLRAYEAMPEPKLVIALGACAASGGLYGEPIEAEIKPNVVISGCPPNPYTILQALIEANGGTR